MSLNDLLFILGSILLVLCLFIIIALLMLKGLKVEFEVDEGEVYE